MTVDNPYQAPEAAIASADTAPPNGQGWKWILFGFSGRIPRSTFWYASIGMMVVYGVLFAIMGGITAATADSSGAGAGGAILPLLMLVLYVPLLIASLAVSIKRWHDRGKSGWWVLIGLVPIIGGLWALVETGFLPGTAGPNRFGTDPLVP